MCHHPEYTKAMLHKSDQERSHQEPGSVDSRTSNDGACAPRHAPVDMGRIRAEEFFRSHVSGGAGTQGTAQCSRDASGASRAPRPARVRSDPSGLIDDARRTDPSTRSDSSAARVI